MAAALRALPLLWALLCAAPGWAQDVLPVPPLVGRVIDQTATLTPAQRDALEAKLAAFEAQAGPQIVLLLVATTAPEDIAAYAQRVADSWKIGRRSVGDGVLVVVAKGDHVARIEVAKALEGAIPDLAARQVIDRAFVPAFRKDDYAGGLNAGLDLLMARIRGEGLPPPAPRGGAGSGGGGGLPFGQLPMFLFIGVPIVGAVLSALFGRKLGATVTAAAAGGLAWWLSASLLLAAVAVVATVLVVGVLGIGTVLRLVAMGAGRGGGGGFGGGGGGGFSSGGGGDFGGGGASGRW